MAALTMEEIITAVGVNQVTKWRSEGDRLYGDRKDAGSNINLGRRSWVDRHVRVRYEEYLNGAGGD